MNKQNELRRVIKRLLDLNTELQQMGAQQSENEQEEDIRLRGCLLELQERELKYIQNELLRK